MSYGRYREDKDVLIEQYEHKYGDVDDEEKLLIFSVMQYDGGPRKLQVIRSYPSKNEGVKYGKMGRLTMEELEFFRDHLDDIIERMKE